MGKEGKFSWRNSGWARFTIGVLLLAMVLICITVIAWPSWLRVGATITPLDTDAKPTVVTESNVDTLRNVGLLIGGVLALVFGVWRAWVAERQVAAAQGQLDTTQGLLTAAQEQVDIARRTSLNDTYQRSAEMLGSRVLAVRLGGIYALQRLAEQQPEEYHLQIVKLLCAFVRNPPHDEFLDRPFIIEGEEFPRPIRPDAQDALSVISIRTREQTRIEMESGFDLNLHGSNLRGASLRRSRLDRADLGHADFENADLEEASLKETLLERANFANANLDISYFGEANCLFANFRNSRTEEAIFEEAGLEGTNWSSANLFGTSLKNANLRGANLEGADLSSSDLSGAFLGKGRRIREFPAGDSIGFSYTEAYTRLTQTQLDQAISGTGMPPEIEDGTTDFETGYPLFWRDRPAQ